jgi:protein-L-isoaspartate(D-aspartate) O-methyltransferase
MSTDPGLATEAAALRAKLAQALADDGAVNTPAWRAAFESVPRHVFVPCFYGPGGKRIAAGDPDTREEWLAGVYSDRSLITHRTDGGVTSSSTQPSLMAKMLDALDVTDDSRALEIGTGTGYNAALLAHRLGDDKVTTVDVLPELTEAARARLAEAEYAPRVVTGDGALGHLATGPYDRIIATCRVNRVPLPWLRQLAGDGLILSPLGNGLARIRPTGPDSAEGRFIGPASFMPLRQGEDNGVPRGNLSLLDDAEPRPSALPAALLANGAFRFLVSIVEPDLMWQYGQINDGIPADARCWTADGSIAALDEDGTAREAGPRPLWTHLEEAYDIFRGAEHPGHDRYGLTVTPEGQRVWLDSPDGPAWSLGG